MENGDSAHSEYPHRTGHNAGHDFVHGTWTVQFLRKPHPRPLPKKGGAFCFSAFMQEGWKNMKAVANRFFIDSMIIMDYLFLPPSFKNLQNSTKLR